MDAVGGENAGNPLGGDVGQETPVIADDEGGAFHSFGLHFVHQTLRQEFDVCAGKIIPDDGPEAAGSKLNHGKLLLSKSEEKLSRPDCYRSEDLRISSQRASSSGVLTPKISVSSRVV